MRIERLDLILTTCHGIVMNWSCRGGLKSMSREIQRETKGSDDVIIGARTRDCNSLDFTPCQKILVYIELTTTRTLDICCHSSTLGISQIIFSNDDENVF